MCSSARLKSESKGADAETAANHDTVLQRVRQQFNDRAAAYDQDTTFHPMLAQNLLPLCKLQPGQSVLDLATGTGLIALQAAAAVGPTGSVTAVDISPGMLEQAKCKYQSSLQQPQQTLARTDFILGGFEQLDRCLDDKLRGCYDVIICSGAVPFLRDPKAAFRDWKLWLKPDGKLVFNAFEPLTEFRTFVQMAEQYGLQEKDPFDVLGSQQKIRDFLQHAGYCEVEVTEKLAERWSPAESVEAYAERMWQMPIANNPFGDPDRLQQLGDQQQAFHDAFVAAVVTDVITSGRYDAAGGRVISRQTIFNVLAKP